MAGIAAVVASVSDLTMLSVVLVPPAEPRVAWEVDDALRSGPLPVFVTVFIVAAASAVRAGRAQTLS